MKKSISTIAITMISTLTMLSQSWTQVGNGHARGVENFYVHSNGKLFFNNNIITSPSYADTVFTWDGSAYNKFGQPWYQIGSMCEYGDSDLVIYQNNGTNGQYKKSGGNSPWAIYGPTNVGGNITAFDSINGHLYYGYNTTVAYVNGSTASFVPGFVSTSGGSSGYIRITADKQNNQMFACGNFTYNSVSNIPVVQFTPPSTWISFSNLGLPSAFSYSTTSHVTSAINYNGSVYMIGSFGASSLSLYGGLYKWNGTSWSNIWTDATINTAGNATNNKLVVFSNKLYFISNGTNIMEFDGTNINQIGIATGGNINDLIVYQNALYIGGSFSAINGIAFQKIAKYSTSIATNINSANLNEINIYPNPFNNNLYIDYIGESTVNIINSVGQKIKTMNSSGKTEITLEHSGIYFIEVSNENIHFIKKVIKE